MKRPLSPSQALALAVLRGQAVYTAPVIVRGRSKFACAITPRSDRAEALRAKSGAVVR